MIRKTISKLLIIAIMVTMVIATVGQTVVNAAESITLALDTNRIINGNKKEAYALNTGSDHTIYQIKEDGTTGTNTNTNFLCLNATVGNGWDGSSIGTPVTYDRSIDLATEEIWNMNDLASAYKNVLGTNGRYKGQIMWLLDNMLIGSYYEGNTKKAYTESDIDEFLAKAGIVHEDKGGTIAGIGPKGKLYYFDKSKIEAVNSNSVFANTNSEVYSSLYGIMNGYYYIDADNNIQDVKLTQELIEAVEQAVIWYFTNNGNTQFNATHTYTTSSDSEPKAFLDYADGSEWKSLSQKTINGKPTGKMQQEQASILYNYLIDAANHYGPTYETKAKGTIKIEFAGSSTDNKIVEVGENYKVGPLKVTTTENTAINGITVTSGTSTTAISGVTLQNASETTITKPTSGQNFY
mgnify:CR=1 FL=1